MDAVDFLHSHEICHGGMKPRCFVICRPNDLQLDTDLTVANVLLAFVSMDDWTEDDLFERFGTPRTGKLVGRPGSDANGSIPRYVVEPANMPDAKYLKHEILLADFGEAFPFGQPPKPKDIGIPFMYRAPETMFDSKLDPSSEVWSLACVSFLRYEPAIPSSQTSWEAKARSSSRWFR